MFGKRSNNTKHQSKLWRVLQRRSFTIVFLLIAILLPTIILVAIVDFVSTAKSKDAEVHSAALRSELSQFALALRDDESAAIAAFPDIYASSQRSLRAVPVVTPFFKYFLKRDNAKSFDARNLQWAAPAACSLDFSFPPSIKGETEDTARICLGYLSDDLAGPYLYFSLRYPTNRITRHSQGTDFFNADHVELNLKNSKKKVRLQLVYEPATLALDRYPSQPQRFVGLHEVTGYFGDDPRRPTRAVSGQAFEHAIRTGSGQERTYVTLLVRIDSSLLLDSVASGAGSELQNVRGAVGIYVKDSVQRKASLLYDIPYDRSGVALMSLEKLYIANVPSKALLTLSIQNGENNNEVWRSDSIPEEVRKPSGFQIASDNWAKLIVSWFGYKSQEANASQNLGKSTNMLATLRQSGVLLPDVATRSFLYLTVALGLIIVAISYWTYSLFYLRRVSKISYLFASWKTVDVQLFKPAEGNNEISMLSRVIYLLISRSHSRSERLQRRIQRERNEQIERNRVEQEHVRNRKAILDAIGHEIKSPLQSLSIQIHKDNVAANRHVQRMMRAVYALDLATSVESGLQASMMVSNYQDVANYVSAFAKNTAAEGVIFDGQDSGVIAYFDPIALDTVFDHILSNAYRLRTAGTEITISLKKTLSAVQIEICNDGPKIEDGKEEAIFMLGVSSKTENGNLGQGLFAARAQMVGMKGSIRAENRTNGVAFILYLMSKQD